MAEEIVGSSADLPILSMPVPLPLPPPEQIRVMPVDLNGFTDGIREVP